MKIVSFCQGHIIQKLSFFEGHAYSLIFWYLERFSLCPSPREIVVSFLLVRCRATQRPFDGPQCHKLHRRTRAIPVGQEEDDGRQNEHKVQDVSFVVFMLGCSI
ncbi:hypothetical protein D4R75_03835 [bacterium]|nr:MAG: hypothetical protein D4R75_03835 [bacterium]